MKIKELTSKLHDYFQDQKTNIEIDLSGMNIVTLEELEVIETVENRIILDFTTANIELQLDKIIEVTYQADEKEKEIKVKMEHQTITFYTHEEYN